MPTSAELHQRRMAAVPRGVGHATAIYAKRAKNAEIWSEDGKRYIDFASGIAVVNTGHLHPKVIAAVEDQLKSLSHACFQVTPYETYVRLAERLNAHRAGRRPGQDHPVLHRRRGGRECGEGGARLYRPRRGSSRSPAAFTAAR